MAKKKKKQKKIMKSTIFFIIIDLLALACFIIMYGPWDSFRNRFVSTAMNTMDHQWLAKIFFSDKKIDNVTMEYLSMGMSGDYYEAILSGSNIIRLGTALFGQRNYK